MDTTTIRLFNSYDDNVIEMSLSSDPHCLVEDLLDWRSSVERLVRSIVVVMMSEPSQPAPRAGWTSSPERVKAIDPHRNGLEPLLDGIPLTVIESPTEVEAS